MMQTNKEKGVKYTLIYPMEKLELTVREGENEQGSLNFHVEPFCKVSGVFYSSHTRMRCVETEFEGPDITLSYFFDSTGLTEGDEVHGNFHIVTEIGEYAFPFYVTMKSTILDSSIGEIKGLFHFVNLARTNFAEATKLFYDPYFSGIFKGSDEEYLEIYRGLSGGNRSERAVEEFLIRTGKKMPFKLSIISQPLELHGELSERYSFHITKEGWGHFRLKVSSKQHFIKLLREEYTEDDFAGNQLEIGFAIDQTRLNAVRHDAQILVECGEETLVYEVHVNRGRTGGISTIIRHDYNKMISNLEKSYMQKLTGEISRTEFEDRAEQYINQLSNIDNNALIPKMFQTILLFVKGHANEAKWILRHIDDEFTREDITPMRDDLVSPMRELVMMRSYMGFLLSDAQSDQMQCVQDMQRMTDQYETQAFSMHVLNLMHAFDDFPLSERLAMLRKLYDRGIASPLLYYEIFKLYQKDVSLMQSLDEMCVHTMIFAKKHNMIQGAIYNRLLQLLLDQKQFTYLMQQIMLDLYVKNPEDDVLTAICRMLMKSERIDDMAHHYYALAVERELRITSLYEYYMRSKSLEDRTLLPRIILLYFTYGCELDYVYAANLYRIITEHKEEISDIYDTYQETIRAFVKKQLLLSHVSDDLAYLYEYFLDEHAADEEVATHVAEVLFAHKVTVAAPKMKYVVLIEKKAASERKVPIANGHAYVNIYDNEYALLLEDEEGYRYLGDHRLTVKKLFHKTKISEALDMYFDNYPGYALFFVRTHEDMSNIRAKEMTYFMDVYKDKQFSDIYRQHVAQLIMQYYFDRNMHEKLDEFLDEVILDGMTATQRAQYIKYLILREKEGRASFIIRKYGFEQVSVRNLTFVFQYLLEHNQDDVTDLLAIANYILKSGRADNTVLNYLVENYEGSVKSMQFIWKEAKIRQLPTGKIAEKIIAQSLYSGAYVSGRQEIFQDYYNGETNPVLVREYLRDNAYQYFSRGQVVNQSIFAVMLEQKKLPLICKIAIVYFLAKQQGQLSVQETQHVKTYLSELVLKGYYFPFFARFSYMLPGIIPRGDKTYVEYHTTPGTRVVIHYMIGDDHAENAAYQVKEMKELYDGYYCEGFDLFATERLQYYISEGEDESSVVQSAVLTGNDDASKIGGRMQKIGQIKQFLELSDGEAVRDVSYEYVKQSYMTKQIFEIR